MSQSTFAHKKHDRVKRLLADIEATEIEEPETGSTEYWKTVFGNLYDTEEEICEFISLK